MNCQLSTALAGHLYISDLDGTLLLPDKTLGARTRAVLERFIASGGLFTVATGRSAASTARILAPLALPVDAITHNGALTVNLQTGSIAQVVPMPASSARHVFERAVQRDLAPLAYGLDGAGHTLLVHGGEPNAATAGYLAALRPLHPCIADDGSTLDRLRGLTLLLLDEPQRIAALFAETCGGDTGLVAYLGRSAYTAGLGVGEVQAAAASKAHAARELARRAGLDASAIVAFGDNANDLPLLLLAGQAYCPPEAVAEVRERIPGRIGGPREEGVASYLEAQLLGGG